MTVRPRVVLFRRAPTRYDTATEVARAAAHRLLDSVQAGRLGALEAEITSALWATGDMVPVVRPETLQVYDTT